MMATSVLGRAGSQVAPRSSAMSSLIGLIWINLTPASRASCSQRVVSWALTPFLASWLFFGAMPPNNSMSFVLPMMVGQEVGLLTGSMVPTMRGRITDAAPKE